MYSNRVVRRFEWDEKKNNILKKDRGVSFEDVLQEMAEGRLLDVLVSKRRADQIVYLVRLNGYVTACRPSKGGILSA